jgi:hypothetical protein
MLSRRRGTDARATRSPGCGTIEDSNALASAIASEGTDTRVGAVAGGGAAACAGAAMIEAAATATENGGVMTRSRRIDERRTGFSGS